MKNIEMVYVLQNGNAEEYKIGYTKDLINRIKQLQTGCPGKLNVIKTIERNTLRVRKTSFKTIEKELHNKFKDKKIREDGEWFKLDSQDLDFIKSINSNNYNEILKLIKD